ncbi:MAG: NUDIX domain-containing protein [Ignavibacteriae bacterium]|nr:NUDIX domain-containing protein [Ignavibacteriota bacterium]MCB9216360.1 NUDIX domain-containing protein [Ignavibacteria bacterium]
MEEKEIIAVAVGLMFNNRGEVLLCQRPEEKSYPLKWEFPGGKVESGETSIEGLRRELREELEIVSSEEKLFHVETTSYSDGRTYRVEYFQIQSWEGHLRNIEFADIAWVHPKDFPNYDILEGNREVCQMIAG